MDETEDDVRYPSSHYDVNYQTGYGSSDRQKLPIRNSSFPRHIDDRGGGGGDDGDEVDIEDEVEEEEVDDEEENLIRGTAKDDGGGSGGSGGGSGGSGSGSGGSGGGGGGGGGGVVEEEDGNEEDDYEDDDISDGNQKDYNGRFGGVEIERHQKKRKLKSLISSYEFAPRVTLQQQLVPLPSVKKPFGFRNSLTEWTEHETFVLLDAWGERFIKRERKSLRSEEWQEVSVIVSKESRSNRKDTQCRNRLDTLKKKYKKEKLKLTETYDVASKWVYFSKMDMLMSGLPRGPDSGEYALMNPKAHKTNGFGVTESSKGVDDDSDGLPPKKKKLSRVNGEGSSVMLLANCIDKFSEIYEKIENSKRQQMLELEKMRMEFQRDLELQKIQLLERARAEIAKLREDRHEEADDSD